jgi:ribosomal protein S18 acetylase RimI-like enzyme
MLIRKAKNSDIEKIVLNNIKLANETEDKKIDYNIVYNGVNNIISDKKKGFYIITEENNKIIGQIMITYEWSDWHNKNIWWIQSVYVNEDYRRKNIFKNMLNYIKKLAEKKRILKLNLYVYQDNIKAKLAYEKIGMKKDNYDIYKYKLC